MLEHERWIAPLPDEIRSAVALRVDQMLAGVPTTNSAASNVVWRVSSMCSDSIRRWVAPPACNCVVAATDGGAAVLRCQASYEEPVGNGASALAAGYPRVFERLGDVIGQALKAAAAAGAASCVPRRRSAMRRSAALALPAIVTA